MHAYAATVSAAEQPTSGTLRPTNRESAEAWSFHFRPAEVGEIGFDLSTMVPTAGCSPQGTWATSVRHGQATLFQHPRTKVGQRLKPLKSDLTVDAAQLQGLLRRGATLPAIAAACERQQDLDLHGGSQFAKALSSGLGIATGAVTWWGCTALTWDQHFSQFVSPVEADEELGSLNFRQALTQVGRRSIINLDAFNDTQRRDIMLALKDSDAKEWVVFSMKGRVTSPTRTVLSSIGTQLDTILPGQLGAAQEDGWSTGDTRVGKFTNDG